MDKYKGIDLPAAPPAYTRFLQQRLVYKCKIWLESVPRFNHKM